MHWLVWNIPGTATGMAEGQPKGPTLPDGSRQTAPAARSTAGLAHPPPDRCTTTRSSSSRSTPRWICRPAPTPGRRAPPSTTPCRGTSSARRSTSGCSAGRSRHSALGRGRAKQRTMVRGPNDPGGEMDRRAGAGDAGARLCHGGSADARRWTRLGSRSSACRVAAGVGQPDPAARHHVVRPGRAGRDVLDAWCAATGPPVVLPASASTASWSRSTPSTNWSSCRGTSTSAAPISTGWCSRLRAGGLHRPGALSRASSCCCRRHIVPGRRCRAAAPGMRSPRGDSAAPPDRRPWHRRRRAPSGAGALLHAGDAQRRAGRDRRGSRQRHPLHRAAQRPGGDRAAVRASAARGGGRDRPRARLATAISGRFGSPACTSRTPRRCAGCGCWPRNRAAARRRRCWR